MSTTLPSSLAALVEAPLAEELYLDWASLLETVAINYIPVPTHLLICLTLLIHPRADQEEVLRATCFRVLQKTLARHGSKAFKQVLVFGSRTPGRSKRAKIRSSGDGLGDALAEEELDLHLATTESICVQFTSLWHLFGCALSQSGSKSHWWLKLCTILCDVLEMDWQSIMQEKLDLAKSFLAQQLRTEHEKQVDLKQIFTYLLANPFSIHALVPNPYMAIAEPITSEPDKIDSSTDRLSSIASIDVRHRLIAMIHRVSLVNRLNLLTEKEVLSGLANTLAPLHLLFVSDFFDYGRPHDANFDSLCPTLLNALLFRLAAYPDNPRKGGERTVDWEKVQGWCASECRGSDAIEIVKVQLFKYILFIKFTESAANKVNATERSAGLRTLLDTISAASTNVETTLLDQTDEHGKWKYTEYASTQDIKYCLLRTKRLIELSKDHSPNSSATLESEAPEKC